MTRNLIVITLAIILALIGEVLISWLWQIPLWE